MKRRVPLTFLLVYLGGWRAVDLTDLLQVDLCMSGMAVGSYISAAACPRFYLPRVHRIYMPLTANQAVAECPHLPLASTVPPSLQRRFELEEATRRGRQQRHMRDLGLLELEMVVRDAHPRDTIS